MIRLPTTYTTRLKSKLDKLQLSGNTSILEWFPNTLLSMIFTRYLITKYGSDCYINPYKTVEHLNETEVKDLSVDIYQCIKKSQDNKPIILGFGISTTGDKVNHQNTLIYRKGTRTLEHFEPHGKLNDWAHSRNLKIFMEKVKNDLQSRLGYAIQIEHPEDICPVGLGLQRIEGKNKLTKHGYCIAWNLFFIELVLCNPTVSSKQLMVDILQLLHINTRQRYLVANDLVYIINGYVMLIYEKITKYLRDKGNPMKIDELINTFNTNPNFKMYLVASMYSDMSDVSFDLTHITPPTPEKRTLKRCPKGQRRNKKTKVCEPK